MNFLIIFIFECFKVLSRRKYSFVRILLSDWVPNEFTIRTPSHLDNKFTIFFLFFPRFVADVALPLLLLLSKRFEIMDIYSSSVLIWYFLFEFVESCYLLCLCPKAESKWSKNDGCPTIMLSNTSTKIYFGVFVSKHSEREKKKNT